MWYSGSGVVLDCIDPWSLAPFLPKITTDNNNHNHCMTKHNFLNNFNTCCCIYLKLSGINILDMPEAIIIH